MFKAQVLRRNFSLFNRVPSSRIARAVARDGHETVTVQRFRIRKPFFSKSRLVGVVAISWAAYGLVQYLGLEVEVEVVKKEQKPTHPGDAVRNEGGSDAEWEVATGEEDDEDDVILFLPTGLSRPAPKKLWRGSDPEWQEFKKIATDSARIDKIRGELVTLIRTSAVNNPAYAKLVGKVDPSKGKQWIDINFPQGPPVEFERPGIELTDDLEWRRATRPVDHLAHQRLSKLLYPTAVGNALYQDTKRKVGQSWKGLRAYMGWEEKPEQPEAFQDLVQQLSANVTPPASPAAPTIVTATPTSSPASSPTDTQQTTASRHSTSDSPAKDIGILLPSVKDMTLNLTEFRKDFRKSFKPYDPVSPRGCFIVMGLVEVYGSRARATLQVVAMYDPKQARYAGIHVSVFNLVEHRQLPRGGR